MPCRPRAPRGRVRAPVAPPRPSTRQWRYSTCPASVSAFAIPASSPSSTSTADVSSATVRSSSKPSRRSDPRPRSLDRRARRDTPVGSAGPRADCVAQDLFRLVEPPCLPECSAEVDLNHGRPFRRTVRQALGASKETGGGECIAAGQRSPAGRSEPLRSAIAERPQRVIRRAEPRTSGTPAPGGSRRCRRARRAARPWCARPSPQSARATRRDRASTPPHLRRVPDQDVAKPKGILLRHRGPGNGVDELLPHQRHQVRWPDGPRTRPGGGVPRSRTPRWNVRPFDRCTSSTVRW